MTGLDVPIPSATAAGSDRSRVPAHRASLIGRDHEKTEVIEHLRSAPVTTLTGPGGVGKTALAMSVVAEVGEGFRDGVKVGWLSPLRSPSLVAAEVASSVGLPRSGGKDYEDALVEWLADDDVLLVLDNCEHVVAAVGDLVDELTARLPRLRVLATSRQPLWVDGEVVYRLAPLPVPGRNATAEEVLASAAGRLFMARATLQAPGTARATQGEQSIGEICRRVDGLPLAIELAAARVAGLDLEDIAIHLDDLFNLLPQTARRADGEQRSLRSTVEWSDALLDDDERVLLHRMSVFAGTFDLDAIDGVCGSENQSTAVLADLTARLVEKSLLARNDPGQGYHMLETIRQYAAERLVESGDPEAVRDAHARWFLDFGLRTASGLTSGNEQALIQALIVVEDNLRLALDHLLDHGDSAAGLELANSLTMFWYIQGQHREGIRWLERALDRAGSAPPELRAAGLFNLAFLLAHDTDDWAAAAEILDEGIRVASTCDETPPILGYLLCLRGECDVFAGESAPAVERTTRGLEIIRAFPDPWGLGFGLWNVGYAHQAAGDLDAAAAFWQTLREEMLDHKIGLLLMIGCNSLGELAERQNELAAALGFFEESLQMRRDVGASRLGYVHGSLPRSMLAVARVMTKQGEHSGASHLLEDALPMAEDTRDEEAADEIRKLLGSSAPRSGTAGTLAFEAGVWTVEFDGQSGHVADVKGLWHLRELVTRPNQPVPAAALVAGRGGPVVDSDAGPMLDRQALRQYRQRLADLDEDLAEAEDHADIEREASLRHEREALLAELARATGLGGKPRRAGSSAERARLNVTRTIRHAIKHLEDAAPALAAHLDRSVRTGNHCAYEPDGDVTWRV